MASFARRVVSPLAPAARAATKSPRAGATAVVSSCRSAGRDGSLAAGSLAAASAAAFAAAVAAGVSLSGTAQCAPMSSAPLSDDEMALVRVTSFSVADVHHIKSTFDRAAKFSKGRISGVEFTYFFGPLLKFDKHHMSTLYRVFDRDGGGSVDFPEFVKTLDMLVNGSTLNKLGFFFLVADVDASGELSPDELSAMLSLLLAADGGEVKGVKGVKDVHGLVKVVMAEVDTDKSGSIDRKEVVKWAKEGSPSGQLVVKLVGALGRRFMVL